MDSDPEQIIQLSAGFSVSELFFFGFFLLFLLILSGLISGSEVAFFSFNSKQILDYASSENKKERLIAKLLLKPKRLLATILISNNLINVSIITLSAFFIWRLAGNTGYWAILFPSIIITFLIIFIGEILPKVYANSNKEVFANLTVGLINMFDKSLYFIAFPLLRFSDLIEKRIDNKGYDVSVEELNDAIELASSEKISEEEKEILRGIVNFSNIHVKQIMCARTAIVAISSNDDFHEVMDKINKNNFSRIPVYNDTLDHLEGILHVKDLLPFISSDEKFNWKILLRKIYYVPETKMIDELLRSFQEKHVHIAIVVDEYGGTSGLITLEDIIEEIVGDINDELDKIQSDYQKINEFTYLFDGKTTLTDIVRILELKNDFFDAVKGESESLGGLLLELHSTMPKSNELIFFGNFEFKIESANARKIKRIRLTIMPETDEKNVSNHED
jgi:putative hemolysin